MRHSGRFLLFALALWCAGPGSHGSLQSSDLTNLSSPGIVQLRCQHPDSPTARVSVGTLIQAAPGPRPEPAAEVVLVTGHGLSEAKDHCSITSAGTSLNIARVIQGSAHNAYADWAVVTLNGRFAPDIQRLPWYRLAIQELEYFIEQQGRVFMLKHLSGYAGTPCQLRIPKRGLRDPTDQQAVVVSDCATIPGMSGAPVILKVDEQISLVGITVGHRYDLGTEPKEWLSRANVVRLIDAQIEQALVYAQQGQ